MSLRLRGCSLLRQCDRYLIEPHRIFKRELIERLFPQAASIAGCPADDPNWPTHAAFYPCIPPR